MLEFGTRIESISYTERPGVYAIIRNGSAEIAVVRTKKGYFLPGGGVDSGEGFESALKREIVEEIGYASEIDKKIGIAAQYIMAASEKRHYKKIGHFYLATLGAKISEITEHELVWISPEESVGMLARPYQVWAVREVCKG
jgi:8-oxo-dGTP diphosphatase